MMEKLQLEAIYEELEPSSILDMIEVTKSVSQVRQGDIFLKKIDYKPKTVSPIAPIGNKYSLVGDDPAKHTVDADAVRSFETTAEEFQTVLVLNYPTILVHDEHHNIPLSDGIWLVSRQREYQPGELSFPSTSIPARD